MEIQLAALINDSAGVICTNTAAVQLAHARNKVRYESNVALLFRRRLRRMGRIVRDIDEKFRGRWRAKEFF